MQNKHWVNTHYIEHIQLVKRNWLKRSKLMFQNYMMPLLIIAIINDADVMDITLQKTNS